MPGLDFWRTLFHVNVFGFYCFLFVCLKFHHDLLTKNTAGVSKMKKNGSRI